jgi:hypothetical protein
VGGWRHFRKARPDTVFRAFSTPGSPTRRSPAPALAAPVPQLPIFEDPPDLPDPHLTGQSLSMVGSRLLK